MKLTEIADAFALEGLACELTSTIRSGSTGESRLYRARQLKWYAERVDSFVEFVR
jgi:hypothetical protein